MQPQLRGIQQPTHSPAHLHDEGEQGVDDVVAEQVRLQPQLPQLGALGVVVVLLGLHPGVGDGLDLQPAGLSQRGVEPASQTRLRV